MVRGGGVEEGHARRRRGGGGIGGDAGGARRGGNDGGPWCGLEAGSQAEGPASGRADRDEVPPENADEEAVYFADRPEGTAPRLDPASGRSEGLSGSLVLRSAASLDQELTGDALQGLQVLEGWAAAARARLIHRQHKLTVEQLEQFNRESAAQDAACGRAAVIRGVDRALAFTLAATEIATMLGIPEGTARALVDESDELCERCPDTLALLERAETVGLPKATSWSRRGKPFRLQRRFSLPAQLMPWNSRC